MPPPSGCPGHRRTTSVLHRQTGAEKNTPRHVPTVSLRSRSRSPSPAVLPYQRPTSHFEYRTTCLTISARPVQKTSSRTHGPVDRTNAGHGSTSAPWLHPRRVEQELPQLLRGRYRRRDPHRYSVPPGVARSGEPPSRHLIQRQPSGHAFSRSPRRSRRPGSRHLQSRAPPGRLNGRPPGSSRDLSTCPGVRCQPTCFEHRQRQTTARLPHAPPDP